MLPPLDVPVWLEPDEPFHPLTGLVAALERGEPVVAVACDQPWVTAELLAGSRTPRGGGVAVDGEYEPFPGCYDAGAAAGRCARRWRARRGLRRTLAAPRRRRGRGRPALVAGVNTPEALAAAERR